MQSATPVEMLHTQTQALTELVQIQRAQQTQIETLKSQNDHLIGLLANQPAAGNATGHLKIENFNMPFWSLVGFLIKLSLASIPAMVVMFIILTIIGVILFFVLSALGIAAGSILQGLQLQ